MAEDADASRDRRRAVERGNRHSTISLSSSAEAREAGRDSVLRDAATLREAANKASQGGKKRIVGLYMPDGNRIALEDKVEDRVQMNKRASQARRSMVDGKEIKQKEVGADDARKRTNLSEVAHVYTTAKSSKQSQARRDKKSDDDLYDEEAAAKGKKIVHEASVVERNSYDDLFNFFDVDKDRNWGSIEFAQRMTDIGCPTNVEDAANLLYFAGVRDVDRITYNDFLEMMPKLAAFRRLVEKDAMRAFSEKDDGSGYITLKQLREVIMALAGFDGVDKQFVENVLRKADRERTGMIPFEFFIRALLGTAPLTPYKRDMGKATFSQKIKASLGRLCGTTPKAPPTYDDDDDEDDRA